MLSAQQVVLREQRAHPLTGPNRIGRRCQQARYAKCLACGQATCKKLGGGKAALPYGNA
ncbi:hypothetical protein GGR75_004117 [Xanthomonas campestris]|nr:hypothetical protein [Xanthomonas campestris]